MDIQIKEIEYCKLSVNYVADAGEILNKRGEILKHFKKAPVPGFRPGKANLDAIKTYYKTQIEESLKRALAEDAYHNTIFEKKLRPHGAPKFNSLFIGDGKFTCEFEMIVKPEFELQDYKGFEIPKPHEPISALELTEKMMQELRIRYGSSSPYQENDFVQNADNIIIDYEGTCDGVKIDSLCAQGEMLTVGASKLPNFDDNLLGMKVNEVREFDLVVPNTGLPSFAGKTVHFKVTVTMGAKNDPCPLDDTLASKVGKKDLEELREFVTKTAMARVSHAFRISLTEAVAFKLLNNHVFEVPNWLVLSEAQYLVHNSNMQWETLADVDKEKYMETARNNVKLSLILDRVRDSEPEAQLSDNEVFEMVKQNIAHSRNLTASPDDIIKEMNRTGYLQILFSRIRDEYTLDFIIKTLKMVE